MFPYFSLKKQQVYLNSSPSLSDNEVQSIFIFFFFNFEVAAGIDFKYLPSVPVLQGMFGNTLKVWQLQP